MENKPYESYNHAKCHIRYHIIFSTKYRKPCLEKIENDVKDAMYGIAKRSNFRILQIGIDKNHIHLLVKSCPSFSIEQIVRRLKMVSTRELWKRCGEILSEFYWGNKKKVWTNGYFCSTVGEVNEELIMKYIEGQG